MRLELLKIVWLKFIDEGIWDTNSKDDVFFIILERWPTSFIFIGADPEIPPCHTIIPIYPEAPIIG